MTVEEEREQADRERLEKMTVKELRVIAKEEFCTLGRNRSRKADLIDGIIKWKRFKGAYYYERRY
nr:MAG TPA_asm: HeH/LEM domain [Caudoviricetes sp.]